MGTLKNCKDVVRHKKIFIMDRNDGECYVAKKKSEIDRLFVIFGGRFIEQLQTKGTWVWIVLDRIPGQFTFKGGKLNERLQRDFNAH